MKLTDEELSRVLTAHAFGRLEPAGTAWDFPESEGRGYPCCLVQAARMVGLCFTKVTSDIDGHIPWFDENYRPHWTVDEFLAQLEARGLA